MKRDWPYIIIGMCLAIIIIFLFVFLRLITMGKVTTNENLRHTMASGSILVTMYEGYSAQVISVFSGKQYNHVALVCRDKVYEVRGSEIKESYLSDWLAYWENKQIYVIEPEGQVDEDAIIKRILSLWNNETTLDLLTMTGLLVGKDWTGERLFCTKFVGHALDRKIPLIPGELPETHLEGYKLPKLQLIPPIPRASLVQSRNIQ